MSDITAPIKADVKTAPPKLNATPIRWRKVIGMALVGFFVGSIMWTMLIGVILMIQLVGSFFPYLPIKGLAEILYRLTDDSGLLLPLGFMGGALYWRIYHPKAKTLLLETLDNLYRNRSAVIGAVMIGFFSLVANFADFISPYHPEKDILLGRPRTAPCIQAFGCTGDEYLMGLDLNGRDLYSRVVWGTRNSLPIGVVAVSVAITIGTLLGLVAGYLGGWLDNIIMRIMDVLLAFPTLLLAIAIVTILGPGLENALIAISIIAIPSYARLTRASVLSLKEQEFVLAERALGATAARIMFGQILPNATTPLIVQGTLGIGTAVLEAAALSFLGLGAQPPAPEWGQMLSEAINYVFTSPHLVFFPGMAIMLTVLGFNLLGDGLRDALDPRLNRGK